MEQYKIGIVGGAGFIGSSLARHMNQSFQVKILDVKEPTEDLGNVEFRQCDIRIIEKVEKCTQDLDLIIHTAIVQIPLINQNRRLGYEVNVVGTQNLCKAVQENPSIKGMILAGSWHTMGEEHLVGFISEGFGFRPDKVEDRARLYALSKIIQESIVRLYDEMSDKLFGVIKMGTVLGEGMSEKTAANIFIKRGLNGETITPYKHSMYRPMLYIDIVDACEAFQKFALKILNGKMEKTGNSLAHIINVCYPEPINILELAEIVRKAIIRHTNNLVNPKIEIVDTDNPSLFDEKDKERFRVNISKAKDLLGLNHLKSPDEIINEMVKNRIEKNCS